MKIFKFCFPRCGCSDLLIRFSRFYLCVKKFFVFFLVAFSLSVSAASTVDDLDNNSSANSAAKNSSMAVGILKIARITEDEQSVYFYTDSPTLSAGSILFHLDANPRNNNDFTLTSITLTEDIIGEKPDLNSENFVNMSTFDEVSYNAIYDDEYAKRKEFVLYRYDLSNLLFYPEQVGSLAWVIPAKENYQDTLNSFKIIKNTEVNFADGTRYTLCFTSEALLTQLFRGNTLIKDFYEYLNMDIEGNCILEDNPNVDYQ